MEGRTRPVSKVGRRLRRVSVPPRQRAWAHHLGPMSGHPRSGRPLAIARRPFARGFATVKWQAALSPARSTAFLMPCVTWSTVPGCCWPLTFVPTAIRLPQARGHPFRGCLGRSKGCSHCSCRSCPTPRFVGQPDLVASDCRPSILHALAYGVRHPEECISVPSHSPFPGVGVRGVFFSL